MNIIEGMKRELEFETISTRKMLERVPADKLDWRPHEKSMTLGALASHIAEIPGWVEPTLDQTSWDMTGYVPPNHASPGAILSEYDKGMGGALLSMVDRSDESLMQPWSLIMDGQVIFEMPRLLCLQNFVIKHIVHHRAQLGVYLRLLDIPIPSTYGPSADEEG